MCFPFPLAAGDRNKFDKKATASWLCGLGAEALTAEMLAVALMRVF